MRTTLDIDEEILTVVRSIALERHQPIGKVLSALARQALEPRPSALPVRGQVPVLPRKAGARPVTTQDVRNLQELDA